MFNLLLKPAPELSDSERSKVKPSAKDLVQRIQDLLMLNWPRKEAARASSNSRSKTPWI